MNRLVFLLKNFRQDYELIKSLRSMQPALDTLMSLIHTTLAASIVPNISICISLGIKSGHWFVYGIITVILICLDSILLILIYDLLTQVMAKNFEIGKLAFKEELQTHSEEHKHPSDD